MSDLTTQLAKAMFASNGGPGWGGVSKSVREIYIRTADTVIAHLTAAGRLIPAGGMALTAEQVQDVRTVAGEDEELAMTGEFWAARDRLRALFPATEPAEEPCTGNLRCEAPLHAEGCYATHRIPPGRLAPAEPAEEETKAGPWMVTTTYRAAGPTETSDDKSRIDRFAEAWRASGYEVTVARVAEADELLTKLFDNGEGPECDPSSSPVVPAPTETGPWQRIEDVPETVGRLTDRDGDIWEWDGDNWITPERAILPVLYINRKYAPFVAAEEG
ncbi:MAG: hypothetical protein WA972_04380 [Rhodococcus qingshengii]